MAKINARLGDVETKYVNATPARYRLKITEVKDKTEGGRQNINFTLQINDGGENQGKKMYQNCALHTLKGEDNRAGLADFKRIAMGALGITEEDAAEYDWDNLDSQDLLLKEFEADVIIESWKNEAKGTSGESNKIKTQSITPVQ
jgi:hypothetical protein